MFGVGVSDQTIADTRPPVFGVGITHADLNPFQTERIAKANQKSGPWIP